MKNINLGKYLLVLLSLLSATPRVWADTLKFANGQSMQTTEINPEETVNNFQYSIVKINYSSSPVTNLTFNEEQDSTFVPDALIATKAHAAILPLEQNVFTAGRFAHEALRTAMRFEDIRPFLTKDAYQALANKSQDGSKELLVLQLIKNSIPQQIDIIQTKVKDDLAWAIARGKMNGQDFWGTLALAREDGKWKLVQESWFGNQTKPIVVQNMRNAQDFLNQVNDRPAKEFVKWVDAAGRPKSTLPLEYGRIKTPKDSFCFFFYLNPEKHAKPDVNDTTVRVTAIASPDLHIVWPSSGVRHDPKVYEGSNAKGFDVSIAADKDGYYPNKINLRMPSGKPKEVYVGFLLSF